MRSGASHDPLGMRMSERNDPDQNVRPSAHIDDPVLLERLRAGDEAAYDAIYEAYVVSLVRFAYSYVGSAAAAEDVVADTFVHVWECRTELAPRYGIKAYLFAAVHHRVRHVLRSDQRRLRTIDRLTAEHEIATDLTDVTNADRAVDAVTLEARLRRALATLPADRRRLIALRWYDELTVPEIAELLHLSAGAVKQRLLRTLDTLRDVLNGLR